MKKSVKRILTIFTATVITAAVAVGCGNKNTEQNKANSNEPVKVSFWHGWTGAEEEALGKIIETFEKENPNIDVEPLPTPFDKLMDKLTASLNTEQSPDLFLGPSDWAGTFAALGQIDEVEGYIKDVQGNYLQSALDAGKFNKKYYGIPESVKTYVLIYNKDLIANPPKTIEEMRELAKANTKDDQYGLVYDMGNFYFNHAFFAGYGGSIFDEDNNLSFKNEGIVESIKLVNDLKNVDKVTIKDYDYNVMMDLMQSGKVAMMINGPWAFGDLDKAVAEGKGLENWGAAIIPAIEEGNPARPFMGVDMLYIPKKADEKDAAAEFAKYMTSAEIQKLMNEKAGHVPSNKTVDLGEDWKSKIILEQAKDAIPMPNIPEMKAVWEPAGAMYGKVLDGILTPEEAVEEARNQIEQDIKEMHGE